MATPHTFPLRVYIEDTDAFGIVHHARYLLFAERARMEMLLELGLDQATLLKRQGIGLAVRRCEINYRRSATLGSRLMVETRIVKAGGASVDAVQSIRAGDITLADMQLKLVCIDSSGSPKRLPTAIRRLLMAHTE